MDQAYILALIRRRELGSAIRALLAISLLDGGQIGKVVHCPIQYLADIAQISYSRAKVLRQRLARHCYIEIVGRQSVRRTPPEAWRRTGLTVSPERDPLSVPSGDSLPVPNGTHSQSQVGTGKQSSGPTVSPEAMGPEPGPVAGLEPGPVAPPKAVKDPKTRKDKQPATADGNASSPRDSDCLLYSEGGTAKAKEGKTTTKQRLQRWSYGAARTACKHLSLDTTDANGIASELRRLAAKHRDGIDDGMRSAAALLEELTVNAESAFAEGGAVVGALRNRWPEWAQPGGTVPTWTPPEPLPPDPEPTIEEKEVRSAVAEATEGTVTIDDVMALAEKKEPPTAGQPAKGPGSRDIAEELALLAELREHAIMHPCAVPEDTETPTAYGREAANHIVVLWRHPDGRESLRLLGKGKSAPQQRAQRRWAKAAWPEIAWDALDVDESAPAATMTTREEV